ncbi:MAG: hypothetical protein AB1472_03205 [Candidatus Omnitrophota bacterium]
MVEQIKTAEANSVKCFKKRKDCEPMSFCFYHDNEVFCSGYVTKPKYNRADIVRLCIPDVYVGDFTPDEALTIANTLVYASNEAILISF